MKKRLIGIFILSLFVSGVFAQKIPSVSANQIMSRASGNDTTYIINFWATWCGPCVAELPQFTALHRHYAGKKVKVLLVSFDFPDSYPEKLTAYVKKKKLEPEVLWFNESNATEFIPKFCTAWSGALPATMILRSKSDYKQFLERPVSAEELIPIVDKIR